MIRWAKQSIKEAFGQSPAARATLSALIRLLFPENALPQQAITPKVRLNEVILLSDLQRTDFLPSVKAEPGSADIDNAEDVGEAQAPLLVEQLDRLQALGVRVLVEDLGSSQARPANLTLVELGPQDAILGPGAPSARAGPVCHGPLT